MDNGKWFQNTVKVLNANEFYSKKCLVNIMFSKFYHNKK